MGGVGSARPWPMATRPPQIGSLVIVRTACFKRVAVLGLVLGLASMPGVGRAQARRGAADGSLVPLFVDLPVAVRFDQTVLAPQRYRIIVAQDGVAFADPLTMVVATLVPITPLELEDVPVHDRVELTVHDTQVEIVVHRGVWQYSLSGMVTAPPPPESDVALGTKTERVVQAPLPLTEKQLVERAMHRYLEGLQGCADSAQKNRWETDDPRFVQCVCPLLQTWRLPKVSQAVRLHQPLAPGQSGFSFTATPEGRVAQCRVWMGPKPPANETTAAPPTAPAPNPPGVP